MVYFIEAVGAGLVKIGFTDGDPNDRLRQLQTGSTHPLRLRYATVGTQAREKLLHAHFAHLRQSGEWFQLTVEIEVWICTDRDFTPVINALIDRIERLEEVTAETTATVNDHHDTMEANAAIAQAGYEQNCDLIDEIRTRLGLRPAYDRAPWRKTPPAPPTPPGGEG